MLWKYSTFTPQTFLFIQTKVPPTNPPSDYYTSPFKHRLQDYVNHVRILSVCLSLYLPVRLSSCMFVCPSLCLPVRLLSACLSAIPDFRLPAYLFVRLPACLSAYLPACKSRTSVYPSVCLQLMPSVHPSVHLSAHMSVFPSVCVSVCLSDCLSIINAVRWNWYLLFYGKVST